MFLCVAIGQEIIRLRIWPNDVSGWRMQDKRLKIRLIIIKRSISEILNDHFKSFLSKPGNIRTWTLMTENACKGLRFNTMPVITTRFGRKRGTLECGLHDVACVANVIGEGEGRAPNSLIFSCFPRSPSLSPMYSASHCSFETKWRRLWSVRGRLPLAQRGFCSR